MPIDLETFIAETRNRFRAPALAAGLVSQGEQRIALSGLLNLETGVRATSESLFQIGSITKLYTALAVMALVEKGRLQLDAPVSSALPGVALTPERVENAVTLRKLLSHTSGLDGDYLLTDQSGIEGYVSKCAKIPLLFRPGRLWSYSNAGYVLLGRVLENATGASWEEAVHSLVIAPAGLSHTVTNPYEMPRFRVAAGHLFPDGDDGSPSVQGACFSKSMTPAGSFMLQSVSDLLSFARVILSGGQGRDGRRVVEERTLRRMLELQHTLPPDNALRAAAWGLGFTLYDNGCIGHDGGVTGCSSQLLIDPAADAAIVVFTNGQNRHSRELNRICREELLREIRGARTPESGAHAVPRRNASVRGLLGRFSNSLGSVDVEHDGSGLRLVELPGNEGEAAETFRLERLGDETFSARSVADGAVAPNVNFVGADQDGRHDYLLLKGRLFVRDASWPGSQHDAAERGAEG